MNRPAIRVAFACADGQTIEREWTMHDAPDPAAFERQPAWVRNGKRAWDRPQDPITYSGDVEPGFEDEARQWVEAL